MSAISLKSITGITSITTPAGVDNQLTLHNNNTTEAVKLDIAGNVHVNNQLAVAGVSTLGTSSSGQVTLQYQGGQRLKTQNWGVEITGTLSATGITAGAVDSTFKGASFSGAIDANSDLDVDGHTNLDNVSVAGVSTFSNSVKFVGTTSGRDLNWDYGSNKLNLADNVLLGIGNSDDILIHHTGSTGYIKNATGTLYIQDDTNVIIGSITGSETGAKYIKDGSFELYHNNQLKLSTGNNGINVSGSVSIVDGGRYYFGSANDAYLFHDGSNTHFYNQTGQLLFRQAANADVVIQTNATERLRITSAGQVQINTDGGSGALTLGASQDFKLYHDAGGPTIFSDTGNQGFKLQIKELNLTDYSGTTTKLKITSDGQVVINRAAGAVRAASASKLEVFNDTYNTIYVSNSTAATNQEAGIMFAPANNTYGGQIVVKSDEDFSTSANRTAHMAFYTRHNGTAAERLRITSNGDVSIGSAANALRRVDVVGNSLLVRPTTTTSVHSSGNADAVNNSIIIRAPYGENAATTSNAGNRFGIQFTGANNTTDQATLNFGNDPWKSASIYGVSEDTTAGYSRKVGLAFYTSGFDAAQQERLRIDSSGRVGIGTDNPINPLTIHGSGNQLYLKDTATNNIFQIRHAAGVAEFNSFGNAGARRDYVFNQYGTEVLRIKSDGKVGINVNNPQAFLDVGGNVDGSVQASFTRANDPNFRIQFRNESSSNNVDESQGKFGLFYATNSADICGMQFHRGSSTGAGSLTFTTGGSERLRIQSTGIVKVETNDSSSFNAHLVVNNSESNSGVSLIGSGSSFSAGGWAAVTDAGIIRSSANSSNGLVLQAASGDMRFYVGGNPSAERLRITSAGRMGLGSSSPAARFHLRDTGTANSNGFRFETGTSGVTAKFVIKTTDNSDESKYLRLNGHWTELGVHNNEGFRIRNSGNGIALYVNSGGSYAFSGSNLSDRNLKEDIETISTPTIDLIKQVSPKLFKWKNDINKTQHGGFIAQEMQPLFPKLISGTDYDESRTDYGDPNEEQAPGNPTGLAFDYDGYTAYLTKAMQELIAKVESLESEVASLKGS